MKKLLLLVLLTAIAGATTLTAQTYKPTFGTKLVLAGGGTDITTNTTTLLAPATGGALSLTLPNTAGTSGYMLTTNGSGILSWTNPSTGITLAGDVSGAAGTNTVDKIKNIALDMTGVADANILIYESTGPSWKARALSGDATITNAGAISVNSVQLGAGTTIVSAVNDAGTSGTINTARLNSAVVLESESPVAAGDVDGTFAAGLTVSSVQTTAGTTIVTAINDAGTTGTIADAGVNDALTISGGTINSTPIGATTASTGRFTTITGTSLPATSSSTNLVVSNAGALETRTVASLSILTTTLTNNTIWIGNGSNVATEQTPGGDVSMTNTGNFSVNSVQLGAGTTIVSAINDAGTAGTIDAANIGNGLTDAQVNNDLTIDGGDIDNTPIGATGASTGKFTGTETGTLKVTGGTPAVGKVLTSNATGDATWEVSGATLTYGVSSPASFGTNQDPLAIADGSSLYRLTSSAAVEIRGLTAGTAGRTVVLVNVGSNAIVLTHSNATTAANGFYLPTGNIIMGPDGSVTCTYDATTARWRVTANY